MKHWAAFAGTLLLVAAALISSEMRKVEAPVGPEPILNFIADTERELTRLPVAFAPLPDAEEIKIGRNLEKTYLNMSQRPKQEDEDRVIESYVQKVGERVAAHARRRLPYRFHYIRDLDFVNAFALPGGPVFIGGGLLALMQTDDELAAVLGHEIEHIDHYHCAERIQVQAAMRRMPLGGLMALPVEVFTAGYGKNQEMEADREGTKLAAAASYSPQGAIQMFEAFERVRPTKIVRAGTPQGELSEVALKTLEGYFHSHPANAERIDQIRKMIAGGQAPAGNPTKPFPLAYMFLTERAWRAFEAAQTKERPAPTEPEKRKRAADRVKQYQKAAELASQSLDLQPDQPRALEILALARFALGDYSAAAAAYRKLLPHSPTFADGVRIYADKLAQQAIERQEYAKAAKLAGESLALQPNQPEALKILAEAQFGLSDFTGAEQSIRRIKNMYPRTADEVRAYATHLATTTFSARRYQEAASLAAQSLDIDPEDREALTTLAQAQFALANFKAAAATYRKILDVQIAIPWVRSYADALSAGHPSPETARDFATWAAHSSLDRPELAENTQVRIELAGLRLMTGDETLAETIIAQAQGPDRNIVAPEFLGRLGWWYYRAGNTAKSTALLRQAVAQRPGNLTLQTAVAWNELAEHQFDEAIRRFTVAAAEPTWNSPVMGRAVARWQAHQPQEAMQDFGMAAKTLPEWLNPRWVQALYPVSVAQSVAEMQAEWQKQPAAPHQ